MNTSTNTEDTRDAREIENDIRATRGDMDQTLDRLNERLSPRSLINSALNWFESKPSGQQGVVSEKSSDILRTVKENPVPALLAGAGIAWLIAEAKSPKKYGNSHEREYHPADNYRHNLRQSYGAGGVHTEAVRTADGNHDDENSSDGSGLMDKAKEKLSEASDSISDTVDRAKERASEFGDRLSDKTSKGSDAMHQAFSSAQHSTSDMSSRVGSSIGDTYHAADRQFRQAVKEVPMGVGLGFLGLGVLAGLLLPRTEAEDELMGDAADDLKHAATDKGEELMEKGKHVASRVADKAMEEADQQGLNPSTAKDAAGSLSDKIGSVVDAVKEEGKAAAEDEGFTPEGAKKAAEDEAKKLKDEAEKRFDQ